MRLLTGSGGQGLRFAVVTVALGTVLCACSGEPLDMEIEDESRIPTKSEVRQTDASGRTLPFSTPFDRRWSSANDGSTYEPCTALSVSDLAALGIDPRSVRDAAGTNAQTARGCTWKYSIKSGIPLVTIIQVVGNSAGLEVEKARVSSASDHWLPDIEMDNRVVGVHQTLPSGACETYVQSGLAGISTLVVQGGDQVSVEELCDRAIEFTKATIDKMPR